MKLTPLMFLGCQGSTVSQAFLMFLEITAPLSLFLLSTCFLLIYKELSKIKIPADYIAVLSLTSTPIVVFLTPTYHHLSAPHPSGFPALASLCFCLSHCGFLLLLHLPDLDLTSEGSKTEFKGSKKEFGKTSKNFPQCFLRNLPKDFEQWRNLCRFKLQCKHPLSH